MTKPFVNAYEITKVTGFLFRSPASRACSMSYQHCSHAPSFAVNVIPWPPCARISAHVKDTSVWQTSAAVLAPLQLLKHSLLLVALPDREHYNQMWTRVYQKLPRCIREISPSGVKKSVWRHPRLCSAAVLAPSALMDLSFSFYCSHGRFPKTSCLAQKSYALSPTTANAVALQHW